LFDRVIEEERKQKKETYAQNYADYFNQEQGDIYRQTLSQQQKDSETDPNEFYVPEEQVEPSDLLNYEPFQLEKSLIRKQSQEQVPGHELFEEDKEYLEFDKDSMGTVHSELVEPIQMQTSIIRG